MEIFHGILWTIIIIFDFNELKKAFDDDNKSAFYGWTNALLLAVAFMILK